MAIATKDVVVNYNLLTEDITTINAKGKNTINLQSCKKLTLKLEGINDFDNLDVRKNGDDYIIYVDKNNHYAGSIRIANYSAHEDYIVNINGTTEKLADILSSTSYNTTSLAQDVASWQTANNQQGYNLALASANEFDGGNPIAVLNDCNQLLNV